MLGVIANKLKVPRKRKIPVATIAVAINLLKKKITIAKKNARPRYCLHVAMNSVVKNTSQQ